MEVMRPPKEWPPARRRKARGGPACGRDRRADGRRADRLRVAALAVLHVREVVAEGRDAHLGQPIGDRLERGVPHVRAGAVAEDEQVPRTVGPDQQGGDFALLGRGEELQLFRFVGHVKDSMEPRQLRSVPATP